MNINFPANAAIITSSVWSAATRSLTNFSPALTMTNVLATSLAASTSVFILAESPSNSLISLGGKAGAAGTLTGQVSDGTFTYNLLSISAAATGSIASMLVSSTYKLFLANNDAANAATYAYTRMTFTQ